MSPRRRPEVTGMKERFVTRKALHTFQFLNQHIRDARLVLRLIGTFVDRSKSG